MTRQQFAELCIRLSRLPDANGRQRTPFVVCALANQLVRAAATVQRLAVYACNEPTDERWERSMARARKRCEKLAEELGCGVTFEGDPRGFVVKLQGIGSNTWGNDGWGVA